MRGTKGKIAIKREGFGRQLGGTQRSCLNLTGGIWNLTVKGQSGGVVAQPLPVPVAAAAHGAGQGRAAHSWIHSACLTFFVLSGDSRGPGTKTKFLTKYADDNFKS
jgi:hypothetical protein